MDKSSHYKVVLKEIREKKEELQKQLEEIKNVEDVLIKLCPHDWHYDGHGHNFSYEKCSVCGETREV